VGEIRSSSGEKLTLFRGTGVGEIRSSSGEKLTLFRGTGVGEIRSSSGEKLTLFRGTGVGEIRSSSGEKLTPKKYEPGLTAAGDKSEGFDAAGEVKRNDPGAIVSSRLLVSTVCFRFLQSDKPSLDFGRSCFFVDQSAKSDDGSSSMSLVLFFRGCGTFFAVDQSVKSD
jgi:hypothetical protein